MKEAPENTELFDAADTGEVEDLPELAQTQPERSRRENSIINNLVALREKEIVIRDTAAAKIKGYDAALLALGWDGE